MNKNTRIVNKLEYLKNNITNQTVWFGLFSFMCKVSLANLNLRTFLSEGKIFIFIRDYRFDMYPVVQGATFDYEVQFWSDG